MTDEAIVQKLLSTSAMLFKHLTHIPEDPEERDAYIEKINSLLDERGKLIATVQEKGPAALENHQLLAHLKELDQGIQSRLQQVMGSIKKDISDLQKNKKVEAKYTNPYGNIQTTDGFYYDGKK